MLSKFYLCASQETLFNTERGTQGTHDEIIMLVPISVFHHMHVSPLKPEFCVIFFENLLPIYENLSKCVSLAGPIQQPADPLSRPNVYSSPLLELIVIEERDGREGIQQRSVPCAFSSAILSVLSAILFYATVPYSLLYLRDGSPSSVSPIDTSSSTLFNSLGGSFHIS